MFVYQFKDEAVKSIQDKPLILGNKGTNLIEMHNMGISVPDGFVVTSKLCEDYIKNNNSLSLEAINEIKNAVRKIGTALSLEFGNPTKPFLFSVRSGSKISMPGMMDSILNLGINDQIASGMIEYYKNERFVFDTYRRFLQMYGDIAMKVPHHLFEECLEKYKQKDKVNEDCKITTDSLKLIIEDFKAIILKNTKQSIPEDPYEQLIEAVKAVFNSWNNKRAIKYRAINNISDDMYTAVNVQVMVYGNINDDSATGVIFSRNPSNGEKEIFGDYLLNAQGEDVVAGLRNTNPITKSKNEKADNNTKTLQEIMPDIFEELKNVALKLEKYYHNMQDIEFTIQNKKLYILQTRNGKRTVNAAINIAIDMFNEGLITKEEALRQIPLEKLDTILHPIPDPNAEKKILCNGLAASPGAACGVVVFDIDEMKSKDVQYILVRTETSPEDIEGMNIAKGMLTSRGGITSHAAVVARGMGKPCVCGVSTISIDYKNRCFITENNIVIKSNDYITIDGSTGEVMLGKIEMIQPELPDKFFTILKWAKELSSIKVYANADTTHDIEIANKMHTDGVGLCRTEHMFFAADRINSLRMAIIIKDEIQKKKAIKELSLMQEGDFYKMFQAIKGKPFNIRLLDPPLHEFMPKTNDAIKKLTDICNISLQEIELLLNKLEENNPMLGNRGCRLGILNPEIYEMQIMAILNASIRAEKDGIKTDVGIIIPLVSCEAEVIEIKEMIKKVHLELEKQTGFKAKYRTGVMIELPSAALIANKIAKHVDFFSFGTNDLTQTTLGISRDDTAILMERYIEKGIIKNDPFVVFDEESVGELVRIATQKGLSSNKNLEIGICGEHGGNILTSKFINQEKMHYTSCSPYKIPLMIIANAKNNIN